MVADDYFDLRSRLGAALFSLGRLADLAGLKPSRTPVVKSLVEGLRDPFTFVVAGEVNAGKSTLLNALFGEEFCPSSVLPETRRIHHFRYGKVPKRTAAGPLLEEIELPHSFLRDFHVVDTPGVNSIEDGHELITGEFIPRADAVLFCFPATNPWSAAAWEFLGRIHQDWLKKIVLVLQQADLRTAEEGAAIAEHMRAISLQRLGVELPVYPVSARLALLARTSGLDKAGLLAASGFPAFEQQLTRLVAGAAPRLGKLITACSAGQAMLAEVQSKLALGRTALAELEQLRETAAAALDAAGRETRRQGAEAVAALHQAWETAGTSVPADAAGERLSFPHLLTGTDPTSDTIESRLLPPLLTAAREAGNRYESRIHHTLAALWKHPGSALHRALEGRVRQPGEPTWPPRGGIFLTTLENAVCDAVTRSGLAVFWQERLRRRQGLMRGLVLLGLLATAIPLAGAARGWPLPWTAAGLAAVLTGGILTGRLFLRRETRETMALAPSVLESAGDLLTVNVRSLIQQHGDRRTGDFLTLLAPLDELIQQKKQAATPLAGETEQLAQSLQALARSLHAGPAARGETES